MPDLNSILNSSPPWVITRVPWLGLPAGTGPSTNDRMLNSSGPTIGLQPPDWKDQKEHTRPKPNSQSHGSLRFSKHKILLSSGKQTQIHYPQIAGTVKRCF